MKQCWNYWIICLIRRMKFICLIVVERRVQAIFATKALISAHDRLRTHGCQHEGPTLYRARMPRDFEIIQLSDNYKHLSRCSRVLNIPCSEGCWLMICWCCLILGLFLTTPPAYVGSIILFPAVTKITSGALSKQSLCYFVFFFSVCAWSIV